jgi:hypothetical protein
MYNKSVLARVNTSVMPELADQFTLFPSEGGGGRFCPPFTSGNPNFFHLPASLHIEYLLTLRFLL